MSSNTSIKVSVRVFLIRHGETHWTLAGKHCSATDVPLTTEGAAQVEKTREKYVGPDKLIAPDNLARIFVAPSQRTRSTAELLRLGVKCHQPFYDRATGTTFTHSLNENKAYGVDDVIQLTSDLDEWAYGEYEGMTLLDIETMRGTYGEGGISGSGWPAKSKVVSNSNEANWVEPDEREWSIWKDGCPGGETPDQVTARVDALKHEIITAIDSTATGWPSGHSVTQATRQARDVVCIGHGHLLAALALRWADQPLKNGMRLVLEPGSIAVLGFENDDLKRPAIFLGRRET